MGNKKQEEVIDECTICLEEIIKGNEVKCSTCIYLCCKDCYSELKIKRCPTCRQSQIIDSFSELWSSGKKRIERKGNSERRWWSNGNEKYNLILDKKNPNIVTDGYYIVSDKSRKFNISKFTEEEVREMRQNWGFIYTFY